MFYITIQAQFSRHSHISGRLVVVKFLVKVFLLLPSFIVSTALSKQCAVLFYSTFITNFHGIKNSLTGSKQLSPNTIDGYVFS